MRLLVGVLSIMLKLETMEFLSDRLKAHLHAHRAFYGRFNREISKAH